MRRKVLFSTLVGIVIAASIVYAIYDGSGRQVTATTTPVEVSGFTANMVTVYVTGTNSIYFLPNVGTNTLATRITAGTAMEIPGGASLTLNCMGMTHISRFSYRASVATTDAKFIMF
jgi:hypothetical protein